MYGSHGLWIGLHLRASTTKENAMSGTWTDLKNKRISPDRIGRVEAAAREAAQMRREFRALALHYEPRGYQMGSFERILYGVGWGSVVAGVAWVMWQLVR